MEPQISVIMTAYNNENYIKDSIGSILCQTCKDFEFIITDDGSTDNTPNIIEEFSKNDLRIIYLQNEKKMGVSYALNRGLAIAKGKYIALIGSESISLPERFERQARYLDENINIGVLGTNVAIFDKNGNEEEVKAPSEDRDLKLLLLSETPINNYSIMMRKSLIDEHNLRYDSNYDGAQDYEFLYRISHFTEFHNLEDTLCRAEKEDKSTDNVNVEMTFKIFNAMLKEIVAEDFYIPLYNNVNTQNSINELKETFRVLNEIPLMRLKEQMKFTRQELTSTVIAQKTRVWSYIKVPDIK